MTDTASIFDITTADDFAANLMSSIHAPHVRAGKSTLGGAERVSVMLLVSLDEPSTWVNGIMENSRYFRMHLYRNGTMEVFSGSRFGKKFRKTKCKSPDDAVKKINKYIEQIS